MPTSKVRVREFDPKGSVGLQYFQEVAIGGPKRPKIPSDITEKWNTSLELLLRLFQADLGRITHISHHSIEVTHFVSTDPQYKVQEPQKPLGLSTYSETVIGTNYSLYIPDSRKIPLWKENYDEHQGFHGFLGLPLEWPGHETYGTLEILSRKKLEISELQEELFLQFAQSITSDLRQLHLESQLEYFSTMDPLTQTLNRRVLEEWIQSEFYRSQRTSSPFAIGVIHMKNLKELNRDYGRPVGDSTLEEIAQIITDGIRGTDELGRWSDTHFMILCPDTGEAGVKTLTTKLNESFESHKYTEKVQVELESQWVISQGKEENLNSLLNQLNF